MKKTANNNKRKIISDDSSEDGSLEDEMSSISEDYSSNNNNKFEKVALAVGTLLIVMTVNTTLISELTCTPSLESGYSNFHNYAVPYPYD